MTTPPCFQAIAGIPEIVGLDAKSSIIRIPPELDVPLTPRVRKIIDSPAFRRLTEISQLGFVSLVYPGARHTRFEHSLGVYRLTALVMKRLAHDERFAASVRREEAELLIATALLHDVGHYPFCHLLEDLYPNRSENISSQSNESPNASPIDDDSLASFPKHEEKASKFIVEGEIADILKNDWKIDPFDVLRLLNQRDPEPRVGETTSEFQRRRDVFRLLASVLSGPIDVDKMDYLSRDSLGAGVPYGRHFDQDRLIGSLCLNEKGDGLAITEKGKTAAELMVFARYVMFSEVYWHHAVRGATVMLQRAFDLASRFESKRRLIEAGEFCSETVWLRTARRICRDAIERIESDRSTTETERSKANETLTAAIRLFDGVLGTRRSLYKRVRQFSVLEEPILYRRLAGRPYFELTSVVSRLIERLKREFAAEGRSISLETNDLLIDAPPVDKEVQFKIDVYYPTERRYLPLSAVSPVVRALAEEQFDDFVKRIRVFARPEIASILRDEPRLVDWISDAASEN